MSDIEANNSETTPEEIVDSIRSIADEGTAEAIHEAIDAAQDAPADDALNLDIAPEGEAEPTPSVDDAVISPASWAEPAAPAGENRPEEPAAPDAAEEIPPVRNLRPLWITLCSVGGALVLLCGLLCWFVFGYSRVYPGVSVMGTKFSGLNAAEIRFA